MTEITPCKRISRGKIVAALACVALLVIFSQTAWRASLGNCATFDEPLHLVAAWLHTHAGEFRINSEDPPLWKYYVAVGTRGDDLKIMRVDPLWKNMLADHTSQDAFSFNEMYRTSDNDVDTLMHAAHKRMIFLGVLLGAAIAFWAWRLRGPVAGVVAAAFFCLDPNFLAHSPIVKNDVPITLAFTALMLSVWLMGERATLLRIFAFALLLGAAITTKFSGILAFPIIALGLLARSLINSPWPILGRIARTRARRLAASAAIFAVSLVLIYGMIWALYDFRFRPSLETTAVSTLNKEVEICAMSQVFRDHKVERDVTDEQARLWLEQWKPDALIQSVLWANQRHLLPQAFLRGFLMTYGTTAGRRNFFCGEMSSYGWWYYFTLAMAFKTPLATIIGLALAIAAYIGWLIKDSGKSDHAIASRNWWPICALLIAPAFYMAFSMRSNVEIGLRHVFPVYPFIFIFLGVSAAEALRRHRQIAEWIVAALILGLAIETYHVYPDFIPFFNAAVGGSRGGAQLLGDCNIDWGQSLPALAEWQKDHPGRQLYLCYFGSADPHYYGIHYMKSPGSDGPPDETIPSPLPPVLAISAVQLQGEYQSVEEHNRYRPLLNKEPIAILGGSIYLFNPP